MPFAPHLVSHSSPALQRLLMLLVGVLLWGGNWASGQTQSPLQDVVMTASQEYGLALHFSLMAQSEVEVAEAALFAAAPGFDYTYTTTFPVADNHVAIAYTLPLQSIRPAPFTTVRYWWELTLADGQQVVLETQSLPYVDNRYAWQSAAADDILVYWLGDETMGEVALQIALQTRQQLQDLLPVQPPRPLAIYVYPSASDLRAALRLGGRDWQDGHADPALELLLVVAVNPRTAPDDLAQSIPEEMSRLFLYLATQAQYETLPRWLVEGMAGAVLGEQEGEIAWLRDAAAQQTLIPLVDLCTAWPTATAPAQLAAIQSRDLVRWLVNEFGVLTLNQLIRAYQTGDDCQTGLQAATHLPLVTLEQQWQNHWRPQPELISLIRDNGLWFLLILAGFLLTAMLLLSYWQR